MFTLKHIKIGLEKSFLAIKSLLHRKVTIYSDGIPFTFKNVPFHKLLNWLRLETGIALKRKKVWGLPTHSQIEPTNLCNLRCALCPVTDGFERPTGKMSLNTFTSFIDQVGDYLFIILLWDWGEPFLNPDVYKMIEYAVKKDIAVISSTNGHPFANEREAEKLVKSGLSSLIFAVDGTTQESYERYRKGGNLETVMRGIENLVAIKKRLSCDKPFINLRFIVMHDNEHEIPAVIEMGRKLGVDAVSLKTLNPHGDIINDHELGNVYLPENPHFRRFIYESNKEKRIKLKTNPCKAMWNCPILHFNGTVSVCTFDPNDRRVMGNIHETKFEKIWKNRQYRQQRNQFRSDYTQLKSCDCCTNAFKGGLLSEETISEVYFINGKTHPGLICGDV
ncbi:radical SAM protein [candidate division KSB1 bacterium]|nr:radical SAM protein [candidate division KSB1 bacterium]